MDPNASALSQLRLTRDQPGHDARAPRREYEHGVTERLRRGIYVPLTSWSMPAYDAELGMATYEPFGISQLEPLGSGAVCVISNVCGCAGFVRQQSRAASVAR